MQPLEWSEDLNLSKYHTNQCIELKADNYQKWCEGILPQLTTLEACDSIERSQLCKPFCIKIGKSYLYKKIMPTHYTAYSIWYPSGRTMRSQLDINFSSGKLIKVQFDGPVTIPVLVDEKLETWMSLTPNEILTLRSNLRRAKGKVAIAGLGLGWLATRILEKNNVDSLAIIECNKHILQYFGKPLKSKYGNKVELINQDAYDHDWSRYDTCLWDIWKSVGASATDRRFLKIRDQIRNNGKVCEGWTCWSKLS